SNWNVELPQRFWRIVRKFGWWGAAYREAIFRLADHAQSREEQEAELTEASDVSPAPFGQLTPSRQLRPLAFPGLDGSNPLAFLAALGILVICDRLSTMADHPDWLGGPVKLSWGDNNSDQTAVLYIGGHPPTPSEFSNVLAERIANSMDSHPAAWVVEMLTAENGSLPEQIHHRCAGVRPDQRPYLDWIAALVWETVRGASSELQTVRKDYVIGHLRSVMQRTSGDHLLRSLFRTWDYADALDNQSLHWEPSEDRRHAYQWHMPSG